jgi:hypothetical protein
VSVIEVRGLSKRSMRSVVVFPAPFGPRKPVTLPAATSKLRRPTACTDPKLCLVEPDNGLDPDGIRWLRGFLRGLAGQGRTVLVSSHVLAEAAQTVDSVVIISHGRLVSQSPLADLTAQAAPLVRIRTPDPERLRAIVNAAGGHARTAGGDRAEVTGLAPERVAALAARESIPVVESLTEQASLEDVFFRLTGTAGTVMTGEFRHKTITDTYLDQPDRARVLTVAAVAGALSGLLAAAVTTASAAGFTTARGYHFAFSAATVVRYGEGAVAGAALLAGVGAALGAPVRNQFAAEQLPSALGKPLAPYLPVIAASTMAGAAGRTTMPPVPAGITTVRRDVT